MVPKKRSSIMNTKVATRFTTRDSSSRPGEA